MKLKYILIFPLEAIGHGIGIPLVMYLNQIFEDDVVGSYVVTILMLIGVVLFQAGHAYRRYRKNQRNKRKNVLTCNNNRGGNPAVVDFHKNDCPNHTISQCLAQNSLTEKGTNTIDREIKLMNGNVNDDAEDLNVSEDSSNCEDPDEDEGKEMSVISNIRLIIFVPAVK